VILRLRALVFGAALVLLVAACGEDGNDVLLDDAVEEAPVEAPAEEPADPPAEEPAEEPADPPAEEPAADGVVVAIGSTDLGDILVDADGMTLYMFDPDDQGPSVCYDECAENWPPLLTHGDPVADGVDEALLGTTERDDGTLQVTYDDWPLYYWVADNAPGDVNGQGVQDVWWVLTADGTPVRDDGTAQVDAQDDGGGMSY
jgi:predicted lipoprotein with Yx(FWY)xxD motif